MNVNESIKGLEGIMEQLETLADLCSRQILRVDEAMDNIKKIKESLPVSLPPDSSAYKTFDRLSRETVDWWSQTRSGYVAPSDCANIEKWLEILQKIVNELEPEFLRDSKRMKKQYYFSAGQQYQAQKTILKVMKRAVTSLAIVDQYLDESIYDYAEAIDPAVKVLMITGSRKPIFNRLYKSFSQSHSNVEAKEIIDCHDRFLIVDETEVWHLGGSINHLGEKAFMISKVIDENEKDRFLGDFKDWWNRGTLIT